MILPLVFNSTVSVNYWLFIATASLKHKCQRLATVATANPDSWVETSPDSVPSTLQRAGSLAHTALQLAAMEP